MLLSSADVSLPLFGCAVGGQLAATALANMSTAASSRSSRAPAYTRQLSCFLRYVVLRYHTVPPAMIYFWEQQARWWW